ncbi:hypothetical protein DPMN_033645 [Dreissena polymorpha]|uniref:Secreted protein n=1 Tax=Dreissena polymorpha TaxID=45954 RepID=A0A9D4M407_DREPO|nr:hypothetical protein DPMN_033645 [Dreissena polymorpha]
MLLIFFAFSSMCLNCSCTSVTMSFFRVVTGFAAGSCSLYTRLVMMMSGNLTSLDWTSCRTRDW